MRDLLASIVAPGLAVTGLRFSKDFRWGTTRGHRLVYRLINTTGANIKAYKIGHAILRPLENHLAKV